MSVRIFEGINHANIYARFRPTVPDTVIKRVLDYLGEKIDKQKWDIAVDVGCGSGQGTKRLAPHFKQCYGFDVSAAQIKEANDNNQLDNIRYGVSTAEKLPSISTNSVQLLTAFEAAHWFDFDVFMTEATRVLVNNGVIALIGYMIPDCIDPYDPDDKSLTELMYDVYFDERLAPFKNPKIVAIEDHYRKMRFPTNYESKHIDGITEQITVSAQEFLGYIESWSLYQGLVAKDPETADYVRQEIVHKLQSILKINNLSAKEIYFKFNYFIAFGRKISDK